MATRALPTLRLNQAALVYQCLRWYSRGQVSRTSVRYKPNHLQLYFLDIQANKKYRKILQTFSERRRFDFRLWFFKSIALQIQVNSSTRKQCTKTHIILQNIKYHTTWATLVVTLSTYLNPMTEIALYIKLYRDTQDGRRKLVRRPVGSQPTGNSTGKSTDPILNICVDF